MKLEQSLQSLRKRVQQQSAEHQHAADAHQHAAFACAIAGAMLALTATTWRVEDHDGLEADDVQTLWGMLADGWPPVAALLLVLTLGVGTFAMANASRRAHVVFVGIALAAAVAVLFAGSLAPTYGLDANDYGSGPGRWLTLLCALALAATHGSRASALR
ncbi:hypothetical protein [Actinophytocola sediminis]